MKGQTIIGETRFIRQKVDQAMEGIGFEKTYKEKTA